MQMLFGIVGLFPGTTPLGKIEGLTLTVTVVTVELETPFVFLAEGE